MSPRVTLEDQWQLCPNHDKVRFAESVLPFASRRRLIYKFLGQAFRYAAIAEPSLSVYADNITRENMNEAGWAVHNLASPGGDSRTYSAYMAYLHAYCANLTETSDATVWYDFPTNALTANALTEQIAWCKQELFRD